MLEDEFNSGNTWGWMEPGRRMIIGGVRKPPSSSADVGHPPVTLQRVRQPVAAPSASNLEVIADFDLRWEQPCDTPRDSRRLHRPNLVRAISPTKTSSQKPLR